VSEAAFSDGEACIWCNRVNVLSKLQESSASTEHAPAVVDTCRIPNTERIGGIR
jgi:hypothetical protein